MRSPLDPPARVFIQPDGHQATLIFRERRVTLPTIGTVVAVKGKNGYFSYQVYVDGLRASLLFGASRLQVASVVDILGGLA